MRKILKSMVIMLALFQVLNVHAASPPPDLPIGLESMGVVDSVDLRGHAIVINDQNYQVADYVVVHGLNSRSISLDRIKNGDRVTFSTSLMKGERDQIITEIWIQPDQ